MDIILASGSPRRRELLAIGQCNFKVMSVDVDETPHNTESPKDYIERMVATKATSAIKQLNTDSKSDQTERSTLSISLNKPFIILTADTIGVLPDGQTVLIKPTDRNHAYSMWQQMSDNIHQVWTAVQATLVTLTATGNDEEPLQIVWQQHIIERTEVTFVSLTPDMMAGYWDSGEPVDKAGGYAIQGLAAAWVNRINGSYTNVVGLPLAQTLALINRANEMPTDLIAIST